LDLQEDILFKRVLCIAEVLLLIVMSFIISSLERRVTPQDKKKILCIIRYGKFRTASKNQLQSFWFLIKLNQITFWRLK